MPCVQAMAAGRVARRCLWTLLACAVLAACARDAEEGFTAARSADGPGFVWNRKPSLESCLHSGMPYARFRRELLSRGWEPQRDPHCRANVVGADPSPLCVQAPDLCHVCEQMPELSVYARDGVAMVWFRHPAHDLELQATAFGDATDRDRLDERSRFKLVAWELVGSR
ncbi:hypothetical protein [Agrilutibacter solisilvae]|uniref:Uncharacterized protein n=1 Tax=Agrilutibacter solisilvae TaxID=2763317 RepID=A0A975ARU7_9GAMM|nr:hypothetical protein [Lysobacter solisilvae]QSX77379.1 hypothetical protein I8J32_011450 [Lysobacter solisilvae]